MIDGNPIRTCSIAHCTQTAWLIVYPMPLFLSLSHSLTLPWQQVVHLHFVQSRSGHSYACGSCCSCCSPPSPCGIAFSGSGSCLHSQPSIFYFGASEVCVMLAAPSYRVIDCCEPTDCPGAWSRRLEHLPAGVGCMTCHRAAAPSPPPLPASKIALAAAKRPHGCCGYHLHPLRHQQGSDKTCILECYDRAWHCLVPCLFFSGSQLGIFNCQPPPLLPAWHPSIPLDTTSQAAA